VSLGRHRACGENPATLPRYTGSVPAGTHLLFELGAVLLLGLNLIGTI
jgi:hypothetical protein